ncbi:MAG: 2-polyprenyl-3-methyl-6-methoxy-1,4-benzoquinone monooxygenase [Porticoccaceae bacterium]
MTTRNFSPLDKLISGADRALRTLTNNANSAQRRTPAVSGDDSLLTTEEKNHAAGLMRVNHSGEVCAQALYQGQALTAKLPSVRREMEKAAAEEVDHLAWCEARIKELGSHTSVLNPLWYGLSFGIGAGAGLVHDRLSLGFVAATEQLVCNHLSNHLAELPEKDSKSRAVVTKMLEDEARHAETALANGGLAFPSPVKGLMSLVSKAMTATSYKI